MWFVRTCSTTPSPKTAASVHEALKDAYAHPLQHRSTNRKDERMNIFASLRRGAEKRRAYVDLLRLDDHLLRDLGISRTDVHQMMNGSRTAHLRGDHRDA